MYFKPLIRSAGSVSILFLQNGIITLLSPPVATSFAAGFPFFPNPQQSIILSIIPSILPACPYIRPLFIQSTVFFPTGPFGASKLILGSCAVLDESEFIETPAPGRIAPPI